MKTQRIASCVLIMNIALFLFISAKPGQDTFDKITVKEFELVGQDGKRRASIKVEDTGEVVLRLMDASGTIRVKVGAGTDGSGFAFMDENTNPAIHGTTGKEGPKLILTDKAGKKREY